ncbi:hypothetical protein C8D87_107457 [Lentzea atacamensis]|uniref:Uncharacterized protein n=2 Tax=Lentzea atacamensis TaxID=531938 RepID=A0ABX9E754_9PSEU|nr:hypothetical protein C8D87_107457 [Lentzea atacamensis]
MMHGRAPDQAEATLADVMSGPLSAADLSRLGATRSLNLYFALGDAKAPPQCSTASARLISRRTCGTG